MHYVDDIDLSNLELISSMGMFAFLPKDYNDEIKTDIKTSFVKYFMGLKSHEYTKNQYLSSEEKENTVNPYMSLLNEITSTINAITKDIFERLFKIQFTKETGITLGMLSTLGRLSNSYESSLFLINNRYYFESMSLNRLIFEQLNYCLNLFHLNENELELGDSKQLRNRLSGTNINHLKVLLPDHNVGRLYSFLSEIAHLDLRQIGRYLEYDEVKKDHLITIKSVAQSIDSALVLLKIVDIHSIVFEYCFQHHKQIEFRCIRTDSAVISINESRESKQSLIDFNKKFIQLQTEIEVPVMIRNTIKKNDNPDLPF